MKGLIGLLVGFVLGAMCRWLDIPVPSPPKLLGALLVVATTIGYMTADRFLEKRMPEPSRMAGQASRPF
jgi:XapX domain-containing protein